MKLEPDVYGGLHEPCTVFLNEVHYRCTHPCSTCGALKLKYDTPGPKDRRPP